MDLSLKYSEVTLTMCEKSWREVKEKVHAAFKDLSWFGDVFWRVVLGTKRKLLIDFTSPSESI